MGRRILFGITVSETDNQYDSTDRLHNCRSHDGRDLRVTYGRWVMYVLHLAHRKSRRMRWVPMDGRLEGLEISMVRTVVRRMEYYLSRKLGTVRLPTWGISCVSTVNIHQSLNIMAAKAWTRTGPSEKRRCGVTYWKQAICGQYGPTTTNRIIREPLKASARSQRVWNAK